MNLRDQLQQTLGNAYTLERELGGGGMSRVFVARDEALRRPVVVKVLPPDLVAGVNVERFNREIGLAAGLQHPHIVPVLSAGQMEGVPYYTMPYVDGESLRARLARTGGLPITEAIGYLRDVAKALAYAHERGVVHRDIKPDNVLISGGSATVTDFGIAKALDASRSPGDRTSGGYTGALTAVGMSLGTPAYMAPEQAAGDPSSDHRADIYSFGCLAYEVLSGRAPFTGKTPQKLLAAHMSENPEPVANLRAGIPPTLADLVMRALAKEPNERPQSAADLVRVLETVTSGGSGEAMPAILLGGRGMLRKALVFYVLAFLVVAIVAKAAIVAIGLPDWVFPGALVVMALGLPVILFTAYVHTTTRRAITATPTYTPGGTPSMQHGTMATFALKASPHMSWRRTALGGAWAIGGFVLLIGGYMLLRSLGIGPFGSLLASGALAKDEKLLVGDFPNPPGDTTLGPVVTEAFRTALAQSQSVNVLSSTAIQAALKRMQTPAGTPVNVDIARQIASREGIRALVAGNLIGIGGKYVVSARLFSAQSGEQLAEFSANASSASDLLGAIDRLAKDVRAKIGESLRNVQQTPPLEQVTTPSLEALRKYVTGSRLLSVDGDYVRGPALLEEAVAIDTGFAMAYRKLGIAYSNRGLIDRGEQYLEKAYVHRERLSDAERYIVIGTYFHNGVHQDESKAVAAYEQLLEIQPNNSAGLNNLANIFRFQHKWERAEQLYTKAIQVGPVADVHYANLVRTKLALGKIDEARQALGEFEKAFPNNTMPLASRAELYAALKQLDSVEDVSRRSLPRMAANPAEASGAVGALADVARMRGKVAEARRLNHESWQLFGKAGGKEAAIMDGVEDAFTVAWFLGDKAAAERILDDTLSRHSLDSVAFVNDPPSRVEALYSAVGKPDKARAVLTRWEQSRSRFSLEDDSLVRHWMRGDIAMASGKFDDAIAEFRASTAVGCRFCSLAQLGRAYDLKGNADSAIAVFEQYINTPGSGRSVSDGLFLAGIYKRLGELYEAKGDRDKAIANYSKFVELWKNADAPLQPKVAEVRAKLARLSKTETR